MSENGDIKINGVIGDLVIRSLSSRVHDKLQRSKRSIDERDYYNEYLNDNFISTGFHIVHKRDLSGKNLTHADNIRNDEKLSARSKPELSGVPEIIYPRILLVTHCNNGFRSIDDPDIDNFILYLLTYWATVDMKFRSFESPKIRLHISGIIIETKYSKSSIIMESLLEEDSELPLVDRGVDIRKIAYKMKLYYKNSVKNPELLPIFTEAPTNVVVAMIGLDLYQAVTDKERYGPADGFTIETQKCHRLSETGPWSVTIYTVIQHWGFHYEGLLTAAHEMGHVLGADHDNTSCGSTDERYMMYKNGASLNISQTSHGWSSCSIESIRKTAEKRKGSLCKDFTQKPRGERMYIPLPGQSTSLDEQCQSKFPQLQSCDPREEDQTYYERKKREIVVDNDFYGSDCRLHCRLEESDASTPRKCRDLGLVLDGSPCRLDYHCINGRCIPIPL